eukprot:3126323-Prymnesium_polylepis.1
MQVPSCNSMASNGPAPACHNCNSMEGVSSQITRLGTLSEIVGYNLISPPKRNARLDALHVDQEHDPTLILEDGARSERSCERVGLLGLWVCGLVSSPTVVARTGALPLRAL